MWPLVVLLVATVAAAGGAGCGQERTLDMDRVNRQILDRVADLYDLPVEGLVCPQKVAVADDATFRCTLVIDGQTLRVAVTQKGADGDVVVRPLDAVLRTADVEAQVEEQLTATLEKQDVSADCGEREVWVVPPSSSINCQVTAGGDRRLVTVTVRDPAGSLRITVEPSD